MAPKLAVLTEDARGALHGERRVIERFPFRVAQDRAPEIICWGDGSPTREFLYVEDCAEAIGLVTERYDGPDPVNVGAGFEVSLTELVALIAGASSRFRPVGLDLPTNGQPRRGLDVSGPNGGRRRLERGADVPRRRPGGPS